MKEKNVLKINGFLLILLVLVMLGTAGYLIFNLSFLPGTILLILGAIFASGLVIVQPNEAKVIIFFGSYIGTIRENGLWGTVPLTRHRRISLRIRNFNSKTLKVNDVEGNPVEIAAVVVFKVIDSFKAVFDVDDSK